jgi:hypothetical protein
MPPLCQSEAMLVLGHRHAMPLEVPPKKEAVSKSGTMLVSVRKPAPILAFMHQLQPSERMPVRGTDSVIQLDLSPDKV